MRKVLLVLLVLSCRYRELPEEIFIYPIREGTFWYYEEEGVGALDSLIVLRDTNYTFSDKVLPAWKVQKSHVSASQGFIIDTNNQHSFYLQQHDYGGFAYQGTFP
jgi:hypothetical protein